MLNTPVEEYVDLESKNKTKLEDRLQGLGDLKLLKIYVYSISDVISFEGDNTSIVSQFLSFLSGEVFESCKFNVITDC